VLEVFDGRRKDIDSVFMHVKHFKVFDEMEK
jgi:hypothetical protein